MKLKLNNVRLAFPDLFEAVQYDGKGPFRYNATFLIVPGSANDVAIRAGIQEVANEKFGAKAASFLKQWEGNSQKFCYLDGNLKEYDGYEGMMYLSAHRRQNDGPPTILDRRPKNDDGSPNLLTAASGKPYAGCYVNASVEIYAQDKDNPGIRCGFTGVQFASDGDAFSGGKAASADEYEDLTVEETADVADLC